MRTRTRLVLAAACAATALALAPRKQPLAAALRERPPSERALHAVLAPCAGWIASWRWLAAGAAMAREDPEAAYDHALELLEWLPGDGATAADLVLYFGVAAPLPLLQESPPREELAFTLVQRAVELGEIALERGASAEVLEVLRLVLGELERDDGALHGLRERWMRARGESPARTAERLQATFAAPSAAGPRR